MRLNIVALFMVLCLSTPALAVQTCTFKLPDCGKVVSSEFSTGGGKTAVWLMEVTCEMTNGNYRTYLADYTPTSALFGFGRFTFPWHVDIVKNGGDHASLICE